MSPAEHHGATADRGLEQPRAGTQGWGEARQALLSGWGCTAPSWSRVMQPRTGEQVADLVTSASPPARGLIARGAGRSYGDAAQNAGGFVLDATALRGILALDVEQRLVRAGAGTTFTELLLALAPYSLTLPVVPGTRQLTVGGAIAGDVHGKNHPRDGSFAQQLESFTLCTPADGPVLVSRELQPDLFYATTGGMGLTGVILEATLRLAPLRSIWGRADIDRTDSIEDALALIEQGSGYRYAIAWVDLLSAGRAFGRSVVTRSDEAAPDQESDAQGLWPGARAPFAVRPRISVPRQVRARLARPPVVNAFNWLHFHSAPRRGRGRTLTMSAQLFPLDVLGRWNQLYGQDGFRQYQYVVPRGREEAFVEIVRRLRARDAPMYLAVVKRFGPGSGGLLSFPLEGWTFAIDLPAEAPGLRPALDEADEIVAGAGGRVYLAKDSRLRKETLAAMYPGLQRFRELRARLDPRGVLRSDMARRLGLSE
jgi:decaprenylphospho-beta-D-ribofuranose 2-oxidase